MTSFHVNTRVYLGVDSIDEMDVLDEKKILLMADAPVLKAIQGKKECAPVLAALLRKSWCRSTRSADVVRYPIALRGEPTYDMVDFYTSEIREHCPDVIVAVGGGSVMDIGKAVGVMLRNSGAAIDYRGMNKVREPGVPVVCIPTTAGTGAEVTHTASLIDTGTNTKMGINGRYVEPYAAVLVPELLYSCPESVTVGSGLDAIVHAYEAITSKASNDITKQIGSMALNKMMNYLPLAVKQPNKYEWRKETLFAAYYAGIAMMNAAGGLASAISYPLGVHYKVPHGMAGGVLFPAEVKLYIERKTDYHDLLYVRNISVGNVEAFYEKLGIKRTLSQLKKSSVPSLTDIVMRERADVLKLCPVPVTRDDVESILYSIASP